MPYFRAEPHEHVVHYAGGRLRRQGRGMSFWYWRINSSIAVVPLNIRDVPFVYQELTSDFQSVTYQGQASFRIADPARALETLNLALNLFRRSYISDDLDLLDKRVSVAVNTATAAEIQARDLAVVLRNFDQIAASVMDRLRQNGGLAQFGVEVVSLTITSIRPTPEVAKAMEAALREELLRRADEAIFARRSAAIAEERKIKEQELATELAIEAKRQELIALAGANQVEEAEARGKANAAESAYELENLKAELELWRGLDPQLIAALGFRSLASKGADNLTITTEVLSALMTGKQP